MAEILQKVSNITIDKVQVTSFQVFAWPRENRGVIVNYSVGYNNATRTFIPVDQKQFTISGDAFDAIVNASPNSGISLYQNIKKALYTELRKTL